MTDSDTRVAIFGARHRTRRAGLLRSPASIPVPACLPGITAGFRAGRDHYRRPAETHGGRPPYGQVHRPTLLDRIAARDRQGPAIRSVIELNPMGLRLPGRIRTKAGGSRDAPRLPVLLKDTSIRRTGGHVGRSLGCPARSPSDATIARRSAKRGQSFWQDQPERVGNFGPLTHPAADGRGGQTKKPSRPRPEQARQRGGFAANSPVSRWDGNRREHRLSRQQLRLSDQADRRAGESRRNFRSPPVRIPPAHDPDRGGRRDSVDRLQGFDERDSATRCCSTGPGKTHTALVPGGLRAPAWVSPETSSGSTTRLTRPWRPRLLPSGPKGPSDCRPISPPGPVDDDSLRSCSSSSRPES